MICNHRHLRSQAFTIIEEIHTQGFTTMNQQYPLIGGFHLQHPHPLHHHHHHVGGRRRLFRWRYILVLIIIGVLIYISNTSMHVLLRPSPTQRKDIGIVTITNTLLVKDDQLYPTRMMMEPSSFLRLPKFFSDHMVLQCGPVKKARIWGWGSNTGNNIVVSVFRIGERGQDQSKKIKVAEEHGRVNGDLKWSVTLPPIEKGSNYEIVITEISYDQNKQGDRTISSIENVSAKHELYLKDVSFGVVFVCVGQSNMEMRFSTALDADKLMNLDFDHIKMITMARSATSVPQDDASPRTGSFAWTRFRPGAAFDTTSQDSFSFPSATCTFTALELTKFEMENRKLLNSGDEMALTPIGLVSTSWGGQPVEAFSSDDAMNDETCGGLGKPIRESLVVDPLDIFVHRSRTIPQARTSIWNGQLNPLTQMAHSGFVFYQGESNTGDPIGYACRFPAMIQDWRRKFEDMTLPFVYVQLAGTPNYDGFPSLRESQSIALKLNDVCSSVAIDLADPMSPYGVIHPRRKREIGRRAALCMSKLLNFPSSGVVTAEHKLYRTDTVATGPSVINATIDGGHSIKVLFRRYGPTRNEDFHLSGSGGCTMCCAQSPFEYQVSVNATARNSTSIRSLNAEAWVRVPISSMRANGEIGEFILSPTAHDAASIKRIRYAWEGCPQCVIYDGIGGVDDHAALPAPPFTIPVKPHRSPLARK